MALAWAALAVLALAVLALAVPVQAADTTFISNSDQLAASVEASQIRATAFTTGSNSGGYGLSSVDVYVGIQSGTVTPLVEIYEDNAGNPGTLHATLSNPATVTDGSANTFTATNTTLSATTTYWLVTSNSATISNPTAPGSGFGVSVIPNTTADTGAATGWSIGNGRFKSGINQAAWANSSNRILFTIRGTLGSTTTTNAAPTVATEIPNQTAMSGTAFSYEVPAATFADADSDTLTYMATLDDDSMLPSWLSFDAATRTFSGTPTAAETVSVKVTASDASDSVSDTFDIVVGLPLGTAMTLVSNFGGTSELSFPISQDRSQAFTTGAGATLSSVEIISRDSGGDDVAVSLCTVDGSDHPTSDCTPLTAPSSFAAGTLVFRAPANTTLAATTTYSLLMTSPGGELLTLSTTSSDHEDAGGAMNWSIANVFDSETSTNVWTANSGRRALYITIKGTITASSNNAPTVATEIPNQTATSGTVFSYQVPDTTFTDADSDTLTYAATLADDTALPSWLSFSAATRTFSGTPTAAETVSVKVTASDASDSVSDTFDIVVSLPTGICSRTAEVQTALLDATSRATCSDVTTADLADVTSLSVSSYSGTILDPADFAGLTGLTSLVFGGSPQLTTVPDNAFAGLTALTNLDFNSLLTVTMVAEDAFSGLTALETLNLSGNALTTLPEDTFDGLTALRILDLSFNELTSLHADIFDGLTALEEIHLSFSSRLAALDADIFDGLIALHTLELGHTGQTTLDADIFDGLIALRILNLSANDLTTLDADIFDGLTALESLNLNNNLLTTLDAEIFHGLTALLQVFLSANLLTTLDADIFDGLTALRDITLDRNSLDTLDADIFDGLIALTDLKLQDNRLTALDANLFEDSTALDLLDLNCNYFTALDFDIFNPFAATLTHLNLESDSFTTPPTDAAIRAKFPAIATVITGLTTCERVTVSPTSLTVTEGATGTLSVALRSQPSGDVTLAISSDNPDVTVTPTTPLTFTALNWDTAQMVTVSAAQDPDYADESATLILDPDGAGNEYPFVSSTALTVVVVDDDDPAVTTLVSNAGQGNHNPWNDSKSRSQPFTTGAAGATLSSVEIISEDAQGDEFAISLCTVDGSNHPTSDCTALTAPSSFAAGTLVFTAPDGTTLAATTTYSLLVSSPGVVLVNLDATSSDNEDAGGATGWSIANTFDVEDSTNTWVARALALRITIKGTITNSAPTVATEIPDQTATSGTALDYTFPPDTFTDADGDTLTYAATLADDTTLPSWLSFAPATRTFSGTPTAVETVSVKVTASDASDSVSDTFDIVVSLPPDTSPTLVSNAGQGDTTSTGVTTDRAQAFTTSAGGTLSSVEIISADSEGDDATVSLCTTNSSGQPTSTCTALTAPSSFAAGTLVFTAPANTALTASTTYSLVITSPGGDSLFLSYTMSDNEDTGGATGWSIANVHDSRDNLNQWYIVGTALRITIKGTLNNAPTVATEIPDQTAMSGTAFSYQFPPATFTDADSDTLTYTATKSDETALPAWLSFSAATRTFSGTPTAAGTVSVKVTASDASDSVSDTFDIVVGAALMTTCTAMPDLSLRRQIWTGELTVAAKTFGGVIVYYGFVADESPPVGALDPVTFGTGLNDYTVNGVLVGVSTITGDLEFSLTSGNLTTAEVDALLLHVCDTPYEFSAATAIGVPAYSYTWTDDLDWSMVTSLTLYLSLPANNAATGAPEITGTAEVGEELVVDVTTVQDDDVIASGTASYEWFHVDGATETSIPGARGALLNRYTVSESDAGLQLKVKLRFTDALGNKEELESAPVSVEALPAITVEADRAKATGKVDFITYTLTREGDPAAALTVTLTFEGPAGNDWGLDPAGSAMRQVTFGAGQATVTQIIKLALGFGNIGFNQSTTEGGTLTARLGAVTGYDTSDTDEVVVVVVAGPAWVIQLSETAYRFTEDGGAQTIVVEATAGSAEMPPPSVSTSNTSAVTSALLTVTGTALAETTMITGDYVSLTETVNTLASGCSVGADNVLVCRTEVTLTLVDDDVAEPDETFDLVLSSAPGSGPAIRHQGPDGMSSSAGNVYPVTIRDDDFAVTGVTLTSTPLLLASGSSTADTYGEGERIEFSVAFTRPVTVTGAPTFSFVLGTATKTATYTSGSDSETLLFAYTVTSSDMDTDGISWTANTLALAGGTIAGTGNLEHSAQTALTGHRVDGSRNAANIPPRLANEIPNQMALVGTAFNYAFLANTFFDADGDALAYTATLADDSALPTWLTFSAATRAFSGTPQAADVGTVAVKVTASDGNGESVSDSFDIVVSVAMDTTAPRVASITRQNPTVSPTNADSLTWRVTFSEAVSNVNAADFAVSGTTATVTAVAVSGLTGAYDVSASGGNLAALNATVTLAIAASHNIEDGASNSLTNTTPTGTNNNSYVVDNTAPSVTISGVPASSDAPFTATFTFPEAVTGFAVGDITLGNASASSFTVTSTTVYTALITPAVSGTVTVDVPANAAQDAAGNGNTAAARATSTYTGTAALPAITIAAGASPVTEGTSAVFTLSRTGSTTDALTVNVTVSEAGGDMVAASNEGARTVTFLANSTTVTLSIATASDSVAEANSVVTATISADTGSPASYSVGTPASAMVTVRDDDSNITVPGVPTDLSSTGGDTRINLSWTAPGDDGGSPITGYKIEVSPDGNANWTELVATGNTTTTYAHIGLAVGTTRHYRVSAINSAGAGRPSNIDDATVIITTVTLRTQSIPEGIGTAAVLVTLNQPAGDPLSVPWYTLNGDAVSPGDYTAGAGQLIIPSGATSATISITIIDDADAEATETVLVLLSPGEGYVLGGSGATLSILDDDGDGPAPIRATVNGTTVVLTYNKSLDGDSTPSSTAFHLRVADNRASVDEVSVNDSEVTLTLASPVQAGQTVSLDYTQPMSNPIQDASGNNKAQSFTRWYLVTDSTITKPAITVPGVPTDLSASTGGDTRINLSWTAPGDDGGSPIIGYKIEVSPDGNANWTELVANTGNTTTTYAHSGLAVGTTRHYRVSAINSAGAGRPSNIDDATVIITTVTLRTQSIPEGIGTATVLVTLNQPAGNPLSVPWYTLSGTAMSPGDYTNGEGTLIIPSGVTNATISITIIDDAVEEPTETVLVLLSPGEGYALGGSGATLSILDDDGDGPAPSGATVDGATVVLTYNEPLDGASTPSLTAFVLRVAGDPVSINEVSVDGSEVTLTLAAPVPAGQTVSLDYTAPMSNPIQDASGNKAQSFTRWYLVTESTITITNPDTTAPRVASITRQNPTVSPTNADSLTWRVTFSEAVSNVNAADFAVSGTTATVTAVAAVSGVTGAYDVTASGGNLAGVSATVTLAIAASHNIQDGASNALSNTAPTGTNDNSYVLDNTAPTVTISDVPATSDAPFTATFTFPEAVTGFAVGDITLGNATASSFTVTSTTVYTALVTPTAAGAVTVDVPANAAQDAAGNGNTAATRASSTYAVPAITIVAGTSPVTEGTPAVFTLSRTGSTTAALTVNVTVSETGGDMVAAANEGARTVTFLANSATATLSVATASDSIDEANSVVTATVSADTGSPASYSVATPASAMVTVQDNDTRGVKVSATALAVNEGTMGTYTVVLDSQPTANVTVTPSRTGSSDVTFSPATLTFTALNWNTVQPVTVTAAQDSDAVDDSATISHAVTGGDYVGVTVESVVVTVNDDETADTTGPRVASIVRETPTSSPTNADSLTWRVTFSEAVSNVDAADFVVSGTTATVTAVAAVSGVTGAYDVTASGGNLAGVSATVGLAIAASHNIQDGASNALSNTAPTGTNDNSYVVDNTAPTVTISDVPATSDAPFTATFTFPEAVTGFVVGDITLGNATASSFTVTSTTVYTALVTPTASGTVTVNVPANAAQDAAGNGNTAATRASSTYTGSATRGVTVSATVLTVTEGSTGAYTVVLDSQPTANVTVTPSRTGSSDVTFSPATLTFTALNWNTVQPVTVTAAQDGDAVDDSATISHAVTGGDYVGVTVESVVVTVNDDESVDTVPGAPTALSATAVGNTQINLSWTAPGENGGAPISGYRIEVSPDGNANWTELVANTGNTDTTYAHIGLAAGTTRHYRVSAINAAGAGDPSNIDDATAGAITIITTGGGGGGGGGPTPSEVDFEWNVKRDIEELDGGNDWPTGLWSDGETLWIAENGQGADDEVYAYDLATGERVESREFALADTNRAPRGIWSDGETVWVSDSGRERLFAYRLADGERVEEREFALAEGNSDARGIWSDGETMWVLDGVKDSLFAYDIASGDLLAEYELDSDNNRPHGIWSDGVTVWVSDHGAKRLFAYHLPAPEGPAAEDVEPQDLERVRDEEFPNTVLSRASNNSPRGIWSDGDVMYVADESDDRVYSYNMPDAIDARLASLSLSGVDIGEFSSSRTEYEGSAADGTTATTVEAEALQRRASVGIDPPDIDEAAEGHQVTLDGVAEIAVTVTSADGSRERVYRVRLSEPEQAAASALTFDCFRGDVAVGFSLVVYGGGSVGELVACAEGRNVTALYALESGEYVSYILGAPEFVNAGFRALFADGIPALTPLTVKSDGPATADPAPEGGVAQPWPECLQGEIVEGFNLVVYEGGSVGELEACARDRNVTAVYTLNEGEYVSYILGAPDFVNQAFAELFADGVPAVTPLVAKSDSPLTASADGGDATEN